MIKTFMSSSSLLSRRNNRISVGKCREKTKEKKIQAQRKTFNQRNQASLKSFIVCTDNGLNDFRFGSLCSTLIPVNILQDRNESKLRRKTSNELLDA